MAKVHSLWSFEDTCRMEDFIKAGKSWHVLPKRFPGRSELAVQAKYFSVKANGARKSQYDGTLKQATHSAKVQDTAFQDAMTRAHAELNRQESITQPGERKRA